MWVVVFPKNFPVRVPNAAPTMSDPFMPEGIVWRFAFLKDSFLLFEEEPAEEDVMEKTIFWMVLPDNCEPALVKIITPTRDFEAVVPWYAP